MPRASRSKSGGRTASAFIVLVLIVVFGGYYVSTGTDPFGLLGNPAGTATQRSAARTETSVVTDAATATVEPVASLAPTDIPTADGGTSFEPGSTAWWEVYFAPALRLTTAQEDQFKKGIPAASYQGSIAEKLVQRIDAAKKTIHIASFETDLDDIAKALIRAKERGVDVRWITDDESGIAADTKPGRGQFKMLKAAGIPIVDDKRGALMHDKYWLFDSQTVWSGSTNVTVSGIFEQNNNVVVIESPALAAIYERQFEDMWAGKFNAKSPTTVDQQSLTIGETPILILFSPEDKAVSHLVPYVRAAQTSIAFLAFTYTQDDLGNAMIERKKSGVDVRGVFESTGSDTEFSEMPRLFCVQAAVRQDGNPSFLHHKVIIIDNHIVVTGSLNFTDNADQQNNENVLVIDNAEIAKLFTQEFQRVWDVAHDPDPAKLKVKCK